MTPPRQVLSVELRTLLEGNIRSSLGDEMALLRLRDSLIKGQKTPILVSGTRIIDGHRRVAAAKLGGITHLDAIDCGDMTPGEIAEFQTVHAFHSESLSDFDRAGALKLAKDQGLTNKQIAEKFDINQSAVTQYLSLFDCPPEVIQAAREGKIGPSVWYQISRSPDPLATLALKLGGASRDEILAAGKRQRNQPKEGETPPEKSSRVKIHLATEAASGLVTVAGAPGEEIDLEAAETILKEALKAVRSAKEKGLSVKSAQSVWRDMAAAG